MVIFFMVELIVILTSFFASTSVPFMQIYCTWTDSHYDTVGVEASFIHSKKLHKVKWWLNIFVQPAQMKLFIWSLIFGKFETSFIFFFTLFFLPVCFVCMPFTAEQGAESYFIFVRNDGEQKEELVKYKWKSYAFK